MPNNSPTILVTGANGFIGTSLCHKLVELGLPIRAAVRGSHSPETIAIGDIDGKTDWTDALSGIKIVVHLAAKTTAGDLQLLHRVNVEGVKNLAKQAIDSGVQRFIFISSIKVNGETTQLGQCFHENDQPAPSDSYGRSKREAEDILWQLADKTAMELVIIRPPLVYGPGVDANFKRLMQWLNQKIPLPLAKIRNKRSLVALDNLIDLIIVCISHPAAANQLFLAGDGEDLSTSELLQRLSLALGKPDRLFFLPSWILTTVFLILGKRDMTQRLCHSLQLDISKAQKQLGWQPPLTVDNALKKTAEDFLREL